MVGSSWAVRIEVADGTKGGEEEEEEEEEEEQE